MPDKKIYMIGGAEDLKHSKVLSQNVKFEWKEDGTFDDAKMSEMN